ncbi:hypothetical protein GCM10010206_21180 [Streptomyces cinerochromogenes]|nr:hypothetical protein GCM10010206_21180 [Streptomyces cinerochromogenes]
MSNDSPVSVQPEPTRGMLVDRSTSPPAFFGEGEVVFAEAGRLTGAVGRVVEAAEERLQVAPAFALLSNRVDQCLPCPNRLNHENRTQPPDRRTRLGGAWLGHHLAEVSTL